MFKGILKWVEYKWEKCFKNNFSTENGTVSFLPGDKMNFWRENYLLSLSWQRPWASFLSVEVLVMSLSYRDRNYVSELYPLCLVLFPTYIFSPVHLSHSLQINMIWLYPSFYPSFFPSLFQNFFLNFHLVTGSKKHVVTILFKSSLYFESLEF